MHTNTCCKTFSTHHILHTLLSTTCRASLSNNSTFPILSVVQAFIFIYLEKKKGAPNKGPWGSYSDECEALKW